MKKAGKLLGKNNTKIMVVSGDLAKEIEELSRKLDTTSLDVICAGLELLKNSLNKEIILREKDNGRENVISALKNLKVNTGKNE